MGALHEPELVQLLSSSNGFCLKCIVHNLVKENGLFWIQSGNIRGKH